MAWGCTCGLFAASATMCMGWTSTEKKWRRPGRELPNIAWRWRRTLPYPDGMFDVVLSHEVIEHVADDRQALAEAVRVLQTPSAR